MFDNPASSQTAGERMQNPIANRSLMWGRDGPLMHSPQMGERDKILCLTAPTQAHAGLCSMQGITCVQRAAVL